MIEVSYFVIFSVFIFILLLIAGLSSAAQARDIYKNRALDLQSILDNRRRTERVQEIEWLIAENQKLEGLLAKREK